MHAFHVFTVKARRAALLGSVCSLVWVALPIMATARDVVPEQPSVEVNIEALKALEAAPNVPPKPAAPAIPYAPAPVSKPRVAPVENLQVAPAPVVAAPAPAPRPVLPPAPAVKVEPPSLPARVAVPPAPAPAPAPAIVLEKVAPSKPLAPLPVPKREEKPKPVAKEERFVPAEQPISDAPKAPAKKIHAPARGTQRLIGYSGASNGMASMIAESGNGPYRCGNSPRRPVPEFSHRRALPNLSASTVSIIRPVWPRKYLRMVAPVCSAR